MTAENAKSLKFWGGIAAGLLAAGFSVGIALAGRASDADFQKHVTESAAKFGGLEASQRNIEADYHWQREQLQRVADRVGAERVPAPAH